MNIVESFKHFPTSVFCIGLVSLSLAMNGCDSGPKKMGVTGTVVFDGKPLEDGMITFEPVDSKLAQSGGATIRQGAFEMPPERGLLPSEYKVSITQNIGQTMELDAAPGEPSSIEKQPIPPKYNVQTTLTRTIESSGDNVFEFNLEAK